MPLPLCVQAWDVGAGECVLTLEGHENGALVFVCAVLSVGLECIRVCSSVDWIDRHQHRQGVSAPSTHTNIPMYTQTSNTTQA